MKYTIDIPIRLTWPDRMERPPIYRLFIGKRIFSCPAPLAVIEQIYGLIDRLRHSMLSHLEETGRRISKLSDRADHLESTLNGLSAQMADLKCGPVSRIRLSEMKKTDTLLERLNGLEARLSGVEGMIQLGRNE